MMERISWIDIEKGLAIILMVIGHSALPQNLSNFIFAFHMGVKGAAVATILSQAVSDILQKNLHINKNENPGEYQYLSGFFHRK